jgi:hypothetical protein
VLSQAMRANNTWTHILDSKFLGLTLMSGKIVTPNVYKVTTKATWAHPDVLFSIASFRV